MRFEVEALLFDLDGTLVSSLAAVERAWTWFADRHGLDHANVMHQIHGRRSIDTIQLLAPDVDVEAENELMRHREAEDTDGVTAVAGARELLQRLPPDMWGIVTSGTSEVARARISAAGLPMPKVLVAGDEVAEGKPAPDCYLLGAQRLGKSPERCLVFEDAGAGVQAAKAAGMKTIGISAVGGRDELGIANTIVEDFRAIAVTVKPSSLFVIAWP